MSSIIASTSHHCPDSFSLSEHEFDAPISRCRLPEVPHPSVHLYQRWGETKIRQLVRYHHYLLCLSDLPGFLPDEPAKFNHATAKTADFFVEVLSRGKFSSPVIDYPALKFRYFRITVDEYAREVWLEMYKKAIVDMKMPADCIEEFWNWIEPLSIRMINRRTGNEVRRYPYAEIWTDMVEWHSCNPSLPFSCKAS